MAQLQALDPEEFRKKLHEVIGASYHRAAAAAPDTAVNEQALADEFQRIRRSLSSLRDFSIRIGEQPPEPPTFRARLGARLVRLVRRMLFWYTPQIVRAQVAASDALTDQLQILQQLALEAQRLEAGIQELAQGARESTVRTEAVEKRTDAVELQGSSLLQLARKRQSELDELRSDVKNLGEVVSNAVQQIQGLFHSELQREVDQLRASIRQMQQDQFQMRIQTSEQDRRISVLLEDVRKQIPGRAPSPALLNRAESEAQHQLDALYVSFEDAFRGNREEILRRLQVYVPLLKTGHHGTPETPILDLGCGRGEWLQLLKQNGLTVRGVDSNRIMTGVCKELGLDATEADLLEYLRSVPDQSVGGVTAFHVLEHLPLGLLIKVLDESRRILKPGGIAIYETPNPENIMVGANTFYTDLTHRNPLPSQTMRFLVEARGLCRVRILHLNPYPESFFVPELTEVDKRFNQLFYGPRDYAVIGYKV